MIIVTKVAHLTHLTLQLRLFGYRFGMHLVLKDILPHISLPNEMYIVDSIIGDFILITPYFCKVKVTNEEELQRVKKDTSFVSCMVK